jgi:hypothetical protein
MKVIGSILAAALLALPACATTAPAGAPVESISYETGLCFGACPVYLVTVSSDGSGSFEGRRFTAVTGRRDFRVTPEQYRAFASRLEPLRPASGSLRYSGPPLCETMATDLPSAEVTWRTSGGEQSLYFYYGCDMQEKRAMAERLRSAPDLLPIGAFIRVD